MKIPELSDEEKLIITLDAYQREYYGGTWPRVDSKICKSIDDLLYLLRAKRIYNQPNNCKEENQNEKSRV